MRRKRESATSSDSFDLFLDTICNTFGGVVFLAILLAIMIQSRSVVETFDTDHNSPPSPDELRQSITQLDSLTARQQTLQTALEALPPPSTVSSDAEIVALISDNESMQTEISQSIQTQARLSRELTKQLESNAIGQSKLDEVPKELDETRRRLTARQEALSALAKQKQTTLRLPRVSQSSAGSMILMMKNRELYLAIRPAMFGHGTNSDQVRETSVGLNGFRIDPIAGAGWSLTDPEGRKEFIDLLNEAKRKGLVFKIAVWPECYQDFEQLRETMVVENVYYSLWPQASDEALVLYTGSGATSVQ